MSFHLTSRDLKEGGRMPAQASSLQGQAAPRRAAGRCRAGTYRLRQAGVQRGGAIVGFNVHFDALASATLTVTYG